jgi:hypothetical protein
MLGADFCHDAQELSTAGQYDHKLILVIMIKFS